MQAKIADLEARAEAAEAKVAAAEERGLVFNMLPDGRLDFCAIREGSRLWDYRVRADALAAQVAGLREAVTWLLNCHRGLNRYGHGVGGGGYWGNIDAATAFAREALAAAPAPEKPSEDLRAKVEKLRALLRETRIDLVVLRGNVWDAGKRDPAWRGMPAVVDSWIARIDAALGESHD